MILLEGSVLTRVPEPSVVDTQIPSPSSNPVVVTAGLIVGVAVVGDEIVAPRIGEVVKVPTRVPSIPVYPTVRPPTMDRLRADGFAEVVASAIARVRVTVSAAASGGVAALGGVGVPVSAAASAAGSGTAVGRVRFDRTAQATTSGTSTGAVRPRFTTTAASSATVTAASNLRVTIPINAAASTAVTGVGNDRAEAPVDAEALALVDGTAQVEAVGGGFSTLADATGEATATALVRAHAIRPAAASASATATATTRASVPVAATASTSAAATGTVRPRITAAATTTADVTASTTGRVIQTLTATASANGTGTATATPSFIPMGMNKNGQFNLSTSSTKVTGWTADTATYPGTVMATDGELTTNGSGTATVHVVGSKSSAGYTHYHQLFVDGVAFGAARTWSGGVGSYTLDFSEPGVPTNAAVTLRSYTSAGSGTTNYVTSGSYVRMSL